MDRITKPKQFLYSIRDEQKEIKDLEDRIREEESRLLPQAIRYDKESVQTSPTADTMPDSIAKIMECTKKLKENIRILHERRSKAIDMIDSLKDPTERLVLRSYFLSTEHKTMYQVSDEVNYGIAQTFRIYNKAIKHLEEQADSK